MSRYLLLGLGKSNLAVAKDLIRTNGLFDVFLDKGEVPEEIFVPGLTEINKVEDLDIRKYSCIIKSPGVPYTHPVIELGRITNIKITNEIGYAIKYKKKPLIAITGTNGKTTTTSLIEHILNVPGKRASAVGNIGKSFLDEVLKGQNLPITELSSFQLRDLKKFNPDVSIWLNIYQAHLDYHKTFEDYFLSKRNIFINQNENHLFIFNRDNEEINEVAKEKVGRKKSFSFIDRDANAYFDGEYICIEGVQWICKNEIGLKGTHNIQNAMASILAAMEYSSKEDIIKGLKTFNGVEHRLEKVIELENYKVYNDSKSTNTTAVKAALSAFEEPVVLMMGGLDRGNGYEDLVQEWSKVKSVICFGQSAQKIYDSANQFTEAVLEVNIDKAIEIAKSKISGGGTLLFSPGCASWDQFKNYEERGHYFKSKISS